jgi:hypothetical protein
MGGALGGRHRRQAVVMHRRLEPVEIGQGLAGAAVGLAARDLLGEFGARLGEIMIDPHVGGDRPGLDPAFGRGLAGAVDGASRSRLAMVHADEGYRFGADDRLGLGVRLGAAVDIILDDEAFRLRVMAGTAEMDPGQQHLVHRRVERAQPVGDRLARRRLDELVDVDDRHPRAVAPEDVDRMVIGGELAGIFRPVDQGRAALDQIIGQYLPGAVAAAIVVDIDMLDPLQQVIFDPLRQIGGLVLDDHGRGQEETLAGHGSATGPCGEGKGVAMPRRPEPVHKDFP